MKLVVIAGLVGLLVTLFGTQLLIKFLMRHGYSQAIRVSTDGVPYPELKESAAPRRWVGWPS
jgi:hypothetical protein